MIRMVYLTLRGVTLTRLLESLHLNLCIMEVHLGACMILRGADKNDVSKFKHELTARRNLLVWLEEQGIMGITHAETITDHYVASCAAALGAWQWNRGRSVWRFAAHPPHHPYDFAC